MRTLAVAIDALLEGNFAHAGDVLMQRFKSVGLASETKHWSLSNHLELIPPTRASALSPEERQAAASLELK